jgi:uncharacterized membrane protein
MPPTQDTSTLSELVVMALSNVQQEARLKAYLDALKSNRPANINQSTTTTMFENVKITNSELQTAAKQAKRNYYALKEKELVIMITLIAVLLFSTVLMFMTVHFPKWAWILALIISGCAITGISVMVYGIKDHSIVTGESFDDKSNKDPIDATLNVTVPFVVFTTIIVFVAAIAALVIWMSARKAKLGAVRA